MLDALTIATGGLLKTPLQIAAAGLLPLAQEATPILLGRRPKIDRRRENDEALLIALGML